MADPELPDSAEPAKTTKSAVSKSAPPKPAPPKPASPTSAWRLLIAAAVAGLAAGALGAAAVVGLSHPGSDSSAKSTVRDANDAKLDVCAAALLARQAVAKNMHLVNPDPENPLAQLAVAANARLALVGGAAYLRGRADADAAAPGEVLDAARAMAGALEHLNVSYLVGQSNSEHEQLGRDLDSRVAEMGRLCQ